MNREIDHLGLLSPRSFLLYHQLFPIGKEIRCHECFKGIGCHPCLRIPAMDKQGKVVIAYFPLEKRKDNPIREILFPRWDYMGIAVLVEN